jgi:exopolysaccharide production protein ExoY
VTPTYPAKTYALPLPETAIWIRAIYCMERLAASIALFILAPIAIAIAVTILVLSRRGPLVSHQRVGWRGAPLPMLKFRTMWGDEAPRAGWFAIEDVSGTVPGSKVRGDSRVNSRFAAFCRRYSLDEIPQLIHVARGEMSLVGPRPITLVELESHYGECVDEVLSMRPGLTGLWQVMGRNRLTYARRKRLDLLLVRRRSASLYFRILLRSIPCVLSGRNAY